MRFFVKTKPLKAANMNTQNAKQKFSKTLHRHCALLLGVALLSSTGCGLFGPSKASLAERSIATRVANTETRRRQTDIIVPKPINPTRNQYEGTLWRGSASWGNLLRDHRARYRGDLLRLSNLGSVIRVPEGDNSPPPPPPKIADPQQQIAYFRQLRKIRIAREQNAVLSSINEIEGRVQRVLSNGQLLVGGNSPPIFMDGGEIKYIVSVSGVARPSDVDAANSVDSSRLHQVTYQVRRLKRRNSVPQKKGSRKGSLNPRSDFGQRLTRFLISPGLEKVTREQLQR